MKRVGLECFSFVFFLFVFFCCFFFNDTATTEIYTLSLHDVFRSAGGRVFAASFDGGEESPGSTEHDGG